VWYPYAEFAEFPQVGSGGRTAMAGPVYRGNRYPADTRLPSYYDGKLFVDEWIRGWIKLVTLGRHGDFETMEPFMEHAGFAAPIDLEVGLDGRLYVLEYGIGWFRTNPDAGLSRIELRASARTP